MHSSLHVSPSQILEKPPLRRMNFGASTLRIRFWHKLSQEFSFSISGIELSHSPEIVGGETVSRRKLFGKILGERLHDGLPPTKMGLPLQNSPPDVPIQKD